MDHRIAFDGGDVVSHAGEHECIVSEPGGCVDDRMRCTGSSGGSIRHRSSQKLVTGDVSGSGSRVDVRKVDPGSPANRCLAHDLHMVIVQDQADLPRTDPFLRRRLQPEIMPQGIDLGSAIR